MNQSQFLDGKLELNKTQVSKATATEFIMKRGEIGLGATRRGGAHNLGLRPNIVQGLVGPNR